MTEALAPVEVLRALPPGAGTIVEALIGAARERGERVYLIGGPVRDLLLAREIRDVDLLVEAGARLRPNAAARLAKAAAIPDARIVEHGRFGTVRIETGEATVDLATARREQYERPGALPSVEAGTLEEDLARRDFSVNALAIALSDGDPNEPRAVIDAHDGLRDLQERRLRILHSRSFHDDPTRALRAARLAPRLGFALSRDGRTALRSALRDGAFGQVSGDRFRREIEKCFSDAQLGLEPAAALRLLASWHVLTALEPGLSLPAEAIAPIRRLGRAIESPPWPSPRWRPWQAGLALWLASQPPALRRRTLRRFAVRGETATRVVGFPKVRDQRLAGLASARGRGAVDALLSGIDEEELQALHASADPAIRRRIVRFAAEDRTRRAPISGTDLTALGLSGPAVGRVLSRVRSAFLDGEVANREEALALAQELARTRSKPRAARRRRAKTGRDPGIENPT